MPAATRPATRPAIVAIPMLFPGDVVNIGYPGHEGIAYVVHETKRKNAVVRLKGQPTSTGYTPDMALCVKTGETCIDDIHAADEARRIAKAAVTLARREATPTVGAIVTLNRKFSNYTTTTLMSVAKVNSSTITLHRLGGDRPGERGVNIDPRGVSVVDMADVPALITAQTTTLAG